MKWTARQICFRLLSPLHVGWRKSGNLQQTRPYVTGRALWGALTARLTREARRADYPQVGDGVNERLAFTYFYPSHCPDEVKLWPWADDWDEFAWTYLSSYVSTSLADGHAAEEGSLHETEFIAPYTREGQPVYLLGYIFQREDWSELALGELALDLEGALGKLQIGGERGYGWGRVAYDKSKSARELAANARCFKQFIFHGAHERPILESCADEARLLAHTMAGEGDTSGQLEPLIGRVTKSGSSFGGEHSKPAICWLPGKKVANHDKFSIDESGLWGKL